MSAGTVERCSALPFYADGMDFDAYADGRVYFRDLGWHAQASSNATRPGWVYPDGGYIVDRGRWSWLPGHVECFDLRFLEAMLYARNAVGDVTWDAAVTRSRYLSELVGLFHETALRVVGARGEGYGWAPAHWPDAWARCRHANPLDAMLDGLAELYSERMMDAVFFQLKGSQHDFVAFVRQAQATEQRPASPALDAALGAALARSRTSAGSRC